MDNKCLANSIPRYFDYINYLLILVLLIAFIIIFYIIFYVQNKRLKILSDLAFIDPITGVSNDIKFKEDSSIMLENCNMSFAIGVVNIKNFRYVNDFYGIEKGNLVLKIMTDKLDDIIAEEGYYARLHSDHFAFITNYFDTDTLLYKLNTYLSTLEILISEKEKIDLKCRCGLYFIENNSENISEALDKAEIALKNLDEVKGQFIEIYDKEFGKRLARNQLYTINMEKALKNQEFLVYLQPKVDLLTEKCIGAEALVRWQSKTMGFVSPGEFIPLFEKNGFVTKVDMYMLDKICEYIANRQQEHKANVTISVNQSRLHLNNQFYINELENIIGKYNVPLKYLEFELTENSFLDLNYEIVGHINKLRKHGYAISIDDFGSGYSSLNLLKDINFDVLKIDQVFLRNSNNSERSKYIIKSVIEMAHEIDAKVVCEGVENMEQVELLRNLGCDIAQGYYYAKPMPIEEFDEYLSKHL